MTSAESDALAKATLSDGSIDHALYEEEYKKGVRERQERMVRESHEDWRALDGWGGLEGPDAWDAILREAVEDLASGFFLIDRLGGEKYLDPKLMAVLRIIRSDLVHEFAADSASDYILIDMVLMHYHHLLTTNTWIGNIIASTQTEMFGPASLTSKLNNDYGRGAEFRGLRIEEFIRRLTEQLMPLIERSNDLLLRNLKVLEDRKAIRAPRTRSRGTDLSPNDAQPIEEDVEVGAHPGPVPIRSRNRAPGKRRGRKASNS